MKARNAHVRTEENDGTQMETETDIGDISRKKTLISILYFVTIVLFSGYMSIIVNDNVPDKSKHPPLPDALLQYVASSRDQIVFAHYVTAGALVFLMTTMAITVSLHKYRHVITRRYFSSIAFLFLWRNASMMVTSLPVTHPESPCATQTDGSVPMRSKQALEMILAFGATTLSGVICGDYMYSGHTVSYLYMSVHITKYSQNFGKIFHPICWAVAGIGICSLIAAFNHYTMDVVVAVPLALFCLTLHEVFAENPPLRKKYTIYRIFFPLLDYLEEDRNISNAAITNDYDWHVVKLTVKRFVKRFCGTKQY
ncbi:sphingomyelin synthase-related protein 1-like [Ptychodera flava]|uniref:sphingomyelin synthase-related protein 1-like n=1 Tax=Ptychodera flava TaxID=63121 RepID=UPI00396A8583